MKDTSRPVAGRPFKPPRLPVRTPEDGHRPEPGGRERNFTHTRHLRGGIRSKTGEIVSDQGKKRREKGSNVDRTCLRLRGEGLGAEGGGEERIWANTSTKFHTPKKTMPFHLGGRDLIESSGVLQGKGVGSRHGGPSRNLR